MERLIIDGYNLIFSDTRYASLAEDDLDAARACLVEDVGNYSRGDARVTVVFDGGGNPLSDGIPHHIAGVTVLFSKAGETADAVIEGLARRVRERGDRALVVTSDAETQWAVMGGGVTRVSSTEFARTLHSGRRDWETDVLVTKRKGFVQDRIDPDVRDALFKWARGGTLKER